MTHHLCERKKYIFNILLKYFIIFSILQGAPNPRLDGFPFFLHQSLFSFFTQSLEPSHNAIHGTNICNNVKQFLNLKEEI